MMVMGSCKWVLIGTQFLGFGDEENIYILYDHVLFHFHGLME